MTQSVSNQVMPSAMLSSLATHASLIFQLIRREVVGRYRGSLAGVAWSFFTPLLMLAVYTFVFSNIFKVRWGTGAEQSTSEFALILFVGLMLHGFFADCISRAPNLVLGNVSYVKKVVFPLEILPWVSVGSALFHLMISVVVLMVVQYAMVQYLPWTALLLPLLLLPFVLITVALTYLFAAIGVYLRDIGQLTTMLSTVLFFLSPIVYPTSSLPEEFRAFIKFSPITYPVEQGRKILIFGEMPELSGWFISMAAALVLLVVAFYFYQKTRRGFADVL